MQHSASLKIASPKSSPDKPPNISSNVVLSRRSMILATIAMLTSGCKKPTEQVNAPNTEVPDAIGQSTTPLASDVEEFLKDVDPTTLKTYEGLVMEGNNIEFYDITPEELKQIGLLKIDENNQVISLGDIENNNKQNAIHRVIRKEYYKEAYPGETQIIISSEITPEGDNQTVGVHTVFDEEGNAIGGGGHG